MTKNTKSTKVKTRVSAKSSNKTAKSKKFKIALAAIGLLIAVMGGFIIYQSFAATPRNCNKGSAGGYAGPNKRYTTLYITEYYFRGRKIRETKQRVTRMTPRNRGQVVTTICSTRVNVNAY